MEERVSAPRLVSLQSTDVSTFAGRLRPLPPKVEASFGVGVGVEREKQLAQFAQDETVVKRLGELIAGAEVSYLDVPGGNATKARECPTGILFQALMDKNPETFCLQGDSETHDQSHIPVVNPASTPRRKQFRKRTREEEGSATPRKAPRKRNREINSKLSSEKRGQLADKLVDAIDTALAQWDQDENGFSVEDIERKHRELKLLSAEVESAMSAGVLHLIHEGKLRKLLGVLRQPMQNGNIQLGHDENDECVIRTALESAVLAMRIITAPKLPSQVQSEEVIEVAICCTKFHLQSNVYAFFSPIHSGLQRQTSMEDESTYSTPKRFKGNGGVNKRMAKKERTYGTAMEILAHVEILLQLIVDLLKLVTIELGYLIPLIRVALEAVYIGSDEMGMCHLKVQRLVAAAFGHSSLRGRKEIFDEILQIFLKNDIDAKRVPRQHLVDCTGENHIQVVSAIVIQTIQISIELPALDVSSKEVGKCFSHAAFWADEFWSFVFKRLPKAKSQKSDGQTDLKAIVENFLADLLEVVNLPEWPGASFLLLRFSKSNTRGLRESDNNVRLMCIDFAGRLASWLCCNHLLASQDMEWAEQVTDLQAECLYDKSNTDVSDGSLRCLRFTLLDHLTLKEKHLDEVTQAACRFQVSSMFLEVVKEKSSDEDGKLKAIDPKKVADLQVEHRALYDRMISPWNMHSMRLPADKLELAPEDVVRVGRAVCARSPYGFAQLRDNFIAELSEAGDRSKNARIVSGPAVSHDSNQPQARSRAIKALGTAVTADSSILGWLNVKNGVQAALQDDSNAVREAAVDLIGRFLGNNQQLALQYFDLLVKSTKDPGLSVRRRSLKLLWECCIRPADFPQFTDACVHILARSNDNDVQVQNIVQRICNELWFEEPSTGTEEGSNHSMMSRAQSLSLVAFHAYQDGVCSSIPLRCTDPLVTVLKKGIHENGSSHLKAGRQLASAIKDAIIVQEEGANSNVSETFPYFLALHALAVADASLLTPEEDNVRFIRFLQPYVSQGRLKNDASSSSSLQMNQYLCILATLSVIAQSVPNLEEQMVKNLCAEIYHQMKCSCRWEVINLSCSALCQLASRSMSMGNSLQNLSQQFLTRLRNMLGDLESIRSMKEGSEDHGRWIWFLFVVGRLCRHGADLLESDAFSLPVCLETFLKALKEAPTDRIKEAALDSLGHLCIARPELMPRADDAIIEALSPSCSLALKKKALNTLTELLKSEEDRMVERQKEEADGQEERKIIGEANGMNRIPLVNGEGDGSGFSSALVQRVWGSVCSLATDVRSGSVTTGSGSPSPASAIRLSAVELMEAVLRGGLVAPWKAVPPLFALATDPYTPTSEKALKLLAQEAHCHPGFFGQQTPHGLCHAYRFQCTVSLDTSCARPTCGASRISVWGMSQIYKKIAQPVKDIQNRYLDGLLLPFNEAANISSGGARKSDIGLLAYLASITSELPYAKGCEICSLIYTINQIVARRGEPILIWLKEIVDGKASTVPPPSANTSQAGTPVKKGIPSWTMQVQSPESAAPTPHCQLDTASQACDIVKAALSVSLLLILKQCLKETYCITDERLSLFNPVGDRRKVEEKLSVTNRNKHNLELSSLRLNISGDMENLRYQYASFKAYMKDDSSDYGSIFQDATDSKTSQGTSAKHTPKRKHQTKKMHTGSTTPMSRRQRHIQS